MWPLSLAQERIWLADRFDPGDPAYNVLSGNRFTGHLDATALTEALRAVVRRHEALRTVFPVHGGVAWQRVRPEVDVPVEVRDLSRLADDARRAAVDAAVRELAAHRFDLSRGPLLRAVVLRIGAEEHELYLLAHHIVIDGWSLSIVDSELIEFYRAATEGREPELPALETTYVEYASRQRAATAGDTDGGVAYWSRQLAGVQHVLDLPTDTIRPAVASHRGRCITFDIDGEALGSVRRLRVRCGVTTYAVLMAAFQVLLARYSRQDDFAVGAPTAGRDSSAEERLVGLFINTVAIRADLRGGPTFAQLLERVRDTVLSALEHQDVPLERVLSALAVERDLSRNPLFQVMLAFNNTPAPVWQAEGLRTEPLDLDPGISKLDLTLNVSEVDGVLRCDLYYATDLFDGSRMERFGEHYRKVLVAAGADPDRSVGSIDIVTDAEHQQLRDWNRTGRAYPDETLVDLFRERAAGSPDAEALCRGDVRLSYRDLHDRALRLAAVLRRAGAGTDDIVGVCLPRGVDLVVALHGIQAAGAAYLPIDPDWPPNRIRVVLADVSARVVVVCADTVEAVPVGTGVERVRVDAVPETTAPAEAVTVDPDCLAYVIQTSGSTGRPKAIGVSHRAITNRLRWMQDAFELTERDRLIQKTPYTFDVSVWEFFWPLLSGAALVVPEPGGHRDPAYLRRLIAAEGVTVAHFVPSMLDAFLDEPDLGSLSTLTRVVCSGEALPAALVRRFHALLPDVALENLYGPTEAAVDVSWFPCRSPEPTTIPIGRPISNVRLSVRDELLRETAIGVPGELCIGGRQLARGYLGRPDLTAERFVQDPDSGPGVRMYRTGDLARWREDGQLDFLGRIDQQVKINGFRVEPGEIEVVAASVAGVRSVAVVLDGGTAPRLVAYVVPEEPGITATASSAQMLSEAVLRAARTNLPAYMVPVRCVVLDALPVTANGKLDRGRLPSTRDDRATSDRSTAWTPEEHAVAAAVRDVLGVDEPGMSEGFFALGGDSIRILKLIARLRAHGYDVSLQEAFGSPTLAHIAKGLAPAARAAEPETRAFALLDDADLAVLAGRERGSE